MARIAPDWDVIREPEAVPAAGKLIFPDFLLRHRLDPARAWLVEIVGFWTPDYLSRKLAGLRAARIPNLILCVDEERRAPKQTFLRRPCRPLPEANRRGKTDGSAGGIGWLYVS